MPSKEAATKTHTGGDKDGGVTSGSGDGGNNSTRGTGKAADARPVAPSAVPEAVQTVLFGNSSKATPPSNDGDNATQGKQPTDVEMEDASVKDKVNHHVKEIEKLFYAYGEQLVQGTQAVLEQAKGVDAQSAKVIGSSWSQIRKKFQPQLNSCLLGIVDSIPDGFEVPPQPVREAIHPRVRVVAFRDLVENARTDITGSLEDLIKWFVAHADDPAAIRSAATLKHEACSQKYNAVLDKMGRDILERMADTGSGSLDFGRDSDYGQALKTQEALAKDRDEMQLQLEGFQKQVEYLKASETELQAKCTELQDKFYRAQSDMLAMRDKTVILDAVTTFLGTDDQDVVGVLAQTKTKQRSLEA
ncbi:hypothetical protein AAVH_21309 [Aphelenchoides avenae]|nr:hypothetical protein AAVH_21309 [Aphelenchus avenae]